MRVHGTAAARAGDLGEARRYLERVLYIDATRDQVEQAHLWLSRVATDPAEQRAHLEEVLASNPTHGEARRELALLDGRLDPAQLVNPDRLPAKPPAEDGAPGLVGARRFVCPQCAGRMRYEPGQSAVECLYCGHRIPLLAALQGGLADPALADHALADQGALADPALADQGGLQESDFVIALATAKGHTLPAGARAFRCEGCQAILLTAGKLSTHCPYCGSSHVVEVVSEIAGQAVVSPEGIIPFGIDAAAAQQAFHAWLETHLPNRRLRTTRVRGVYLPVWTFDLLGEIAWRGVEAEQRGSLGGLNLLGGLSLGESGVQIRGSRRPGMQRQVHQGSHYVMIDDALVPASHKVPYALRGLFEGFDWSCAVPYDVSYLSDWPAEIYEISVSDASLVARREVLEQARGKVEIQAEAQVGQLQSIKIFPSNLTVDSYKLMLVPVWIANYRCEDVTYMVVINGQTGAAMGQEPVSGLRKLFGGI
jgi:DNA-directed RNA polymerase subunit RPC12/RpoP